MGKYYQLKNVRGFKSISINGRLLPAGRAVSVDEAFLLDPSVVGLIQASRLVVEGGMPSTLASLLELPSVSSEELKEVPAEPAPVEAPEAPKEEEIPPVSIETQELDEPEEAEEPVSPLFDAAGLESMSYKKVRSTAKSLGISAKGTKAEVIDSILSSQEN